MCAFFNFREKNDPMKRIGFLLVAAMVLAGSAARGQGLSIFADQSYEPVLQELVKQFSDQTGFAVQLSLGRAAILAERLRDGTPADVFFPANEEQMNQVMEKGLVDVSLKRNVLVLPPTEPVEEGIVPEPQYVPAAVLANSTNRVQAMAFLEFLVSEPARAAFGQQGFTLP